MIAACPKCQAKYRIRSEKLGPDGSRLRCSQCDTIFRIRRPAGSPAPAAAETRGEGQNHLLIADPDVEAGKALAGRLADWGLQAILVHDGVEAMLTIQRMLPRAAILQARLPKMLGSEVCEIVKRNESLRSTGVVLVGARQHPDDDAGPMYGADAYLERAQLAEDLAPALRKLGFAPRERSDAAAAAPNSLD